MKLRPFTHHSKCFFFHTADHVSLNEPKEQRKIARKTQKLSLGTGALDYNKLKISIKCLTEGHDNLCVHRLSKGKMSGYLTCTSW